MLSVGSTVLMAEVLEQSLHEAPVGWKKDPCLYARALGTCTCGG